MFRNSVINFLLSILIFVSYCSSSSVRDAWIRHSENVYKFKCQIPQPRSLELREVFKLDDPLVIDSDKVFPSSTVLHRCERAGCCSGYKQCRANTTEEIDLVFGVIDKGTAVIEYVHRNVVNHTLCSCQRRADTFK